MINAVGDARFEIDPGRGVVAEGGEQLVARGDDPGHGVGERVEDQSVAGVLLADRRQRPCTAGAVETYPGVGEPNLDGLLRRDPPLRLRQQPDRDHRRRGPAGSSGDGERPHRQPVAVRRHQAEFGRHRLDQHPTEYGDLPAAVDGGGDLPDRLGQQPAGHGPGVAVPADDDGERVGRAAAGGLDGPFHRAQVLGQQLLGDLGRRVQQPPDGTQRQARLA